MSFGTSWQLPSEGLSLLLDAANVKSYPGSGTSWFDLSGNSNTGTLTNGPTYNSDGYFAFDGTNDYVVVADDDTLKLTQRPQATDTHTHTDAPTHRHTHTVIRWH